MEFFKKTYGIPTRLGFSRYGIHQVDLNSSAYKYVEGVNSTVSDDGFAAKMRLVEYSASFRAQCWITQTLDFVDDLMGFIRVLSGELGLNNPVKLFWQTLPFSFVVDWFLKVSTHLDHLTRLQPPVGWDINSISCSTKLQMTWRVSMFTSLNYPTDTDLVYADIRVEWYDRYNGLPFDLDLLNLNQLSEHQYALLLAMLAA
jgi:hypothetical protein